MALGPLALDPLEPRRVLRHEVRRPTAEDGVLVVGITGAGKTTMARRLAACCGLQHHELDALAIGVGWSDRPEFISDVASFTARGGWVTDSYGADLQARALLWDRASYVVWLDLPLPITAWRAARRSVQRSHSREPVFAGNVETWSGWLSTSHPLWSSIRGFRTRRRVVAELIAEHRLTGVRLRHPGHVRRFLASCQQRRPHGGPVTIARCTPSVSPSPSPSRR